MKIIQRIREIKLPFLAVVAALVFGGVVAPANAAAPTVTSASAGAGGETSYLLGYRTDQAGGTCKLVARLASASAPTSAELIARTAAISGDVFFDSRTDPGTAGVYVTATGLTASTNYTYYVACTDGLGNNSAVVSTSFTTYAPPAQVTFDANRPSGVTATVTNMPQMSPVNIMGQVMTLQGYRTPSLQGYIFGGWQTQTNGGTVYSELMSFPSTSNITVYAKWTAVGGPSNPPSNNNNQQAPTTAAVQRPLPQISFATNPAPGFSVRPTSDTRKGTLTLKGENFSDLTAITIGGKKADFTVKDGKLEIKLPAGVTGFPEVVMTNGGGSITMQNAIEIVENKVQKLTRFVGDRFTKAGLETLENACIDNKEATSIEAIVVVAADATEADYANAVKAATDAATYLDKVSKRISHTSVTVVKTGAAGSKPTVEMNFTKQ